LKTAILGAGISGLALARFLIEAGLAPADVHLFEASPHVGGLCRSRTVDGFTYDVAGGHILYSKDAAAMSWMKQHAGGESAFVRKDRHTRIRYEDRWVHYPFENGLGDLPPQVNYECLKGYVEAWHRRKCNGSQAPLDFASWIEWRFGPGIARHFMAPYNEKIWKRPLGELTSDWVAGRVPDAPIDDVLQSSVGLRTEGYVHQAIFYYPLEGGFQAITDGLAAPIGARIRLSTPVRELRRVGERHSVNGEDFDCVVSTLPLHDLPRLVHGMPESIAQALRGLQYNSLYSLLIALDRPEQPDLSWIYLPAHAQGPANRVTYMSNYSPRLAPAGKSSLMCEVTWRPEQGAPGPELEREVVDGLVHAGLLRKDEILFTDHSTVSLAYILYVHGHAERRAAGIEWLESQGIWPLGRFGRYDYHNSDQCVIAARALAAQLAARARAG